MIRTGMKTFKSESRYIARHAGLIVPPGCAPLQVTQYFPPAGWIGVPNAIARLSYRPHSYHIGIIRKLQ